MTQLVRRNISLEPEDYTVVREHAQEWGQSFSAALRLIIREWQRLKGRRPDPDADRQADPPAPARAIVHRYRSLSAKAGAIIALPTSNPKRLSTRGRSDWTCRSNRCFSATSTRSRSIVLANSVDKRQWFIVFSFLSLAFPARNDPQGPFCAIIDSTFISASYRLSVFRFLCIHYSWRPAQNR